MRTRAIYVGDVRRDAVLVFELQGSEFVCLANPEVRYDVHTVLADKDWIIFSIDQDEDGVEYVANVCC